MARAGGPLRARMMGSSAPTPLPGRLRPVQQTAEEAMAVLARERGPVPEVSAGAA